MILKGKTQKGKNRIRECGTDKWFIIHQKNRVLFDSRPGPWALVAPDIDSPSKSVILRRWIHLTDDKDFEVIND